MPVKPSRRFVLLSLAGAGTVLACGCALATPEPKPAAPPDSEWPAAFKKMRTLRGHFNGGQWNDTVDRWQGDKHVLMQRLAEQALQSRARAEQVSALMGEPDARVPPAAATHQRMLQEAQWRQSLPASDALLWSYHWRGTHDQLLLAFDARTQTVTRIGWLHNWE